jgi:signal transduction histidine kinase
MCDLYCTNYWRALRWLMIKEMRTGPGLAIACTVIERFEGEISAENCRDVGAVFRFSLPLVKEFAA